MKSWPPLITLLALLFTGEIRSAEETAERVADKGTNRFEFLQAQMGLPFRIVLYADERAAAETAATAAFARIAELNSILSDYEHDSELMKLSRSSGAGEWIEVSADLWTVLERAQALAERSGGAFDITVGPAVQLWRRARRQHRLPAPEQLADALGRVGYRHIELNQAERSALLKASGMRLDAGGIAKGYAVDEALEVLGAHGISRALVAGGGDLAVGAAPPGQAGWRVDIAPLDHPEAPPAQQALLEHKALATSGDVFQHVVLDGRRYSHIVDPRTCVGLTNSSLVTVIASSCSVADSLATAVSVLGPEKGLELTERTSGAEVYIVHPEANQVRSIQSTGWGRVCGAVGP